MTGAGSVGQCGHTPISTHLSSWTYRVSGRMLSSGVQVPDVLIAAMKLPGDSRPTGVGMLEVVVCIRPEKCSQKSDNAAEICALVNCIGV